jgi:alpha-N-arabinofuranosidase
MATYNDRFTAFYDAIKAKDPNIHVISTIPSNVRNFEYTRKPDIVDDHYYRQPQANAGDAHHYDQSDRYDRTGPKIFVGEWASQSNPRGDTPKMVDALGDAAWMTGFERNADLVVMSCYAPLFVNVNPGGRQWATNLIGYDALTSFGSPSYYAQKMFNQNQGNVVLPADLGENATELYACASRDDASGDVIVKLVNRRSQPVKIDFDLQGSGTIGRIATLETLTGPLDGVNTVAEPKAIVPKKGTVAVAGPKFSHVFAADSVNILRFKTR